MQFLRIEDEIGYLKKRYEIKKKIEDMFLNEGYVQIEPSIFEDFDIFEHVNKWLKKESMVKVIGGSSDVLILRPDITTNIIRNLIPRWQEGFKLKLFYNSSIYRNQEIVNIREVRQMGIEYLGEDSLKADKEVVLLALKILDSFDSRFILEMSNSKYINGLLKEMDIEENHKRHIKDLIYRKNRQELVSYMGILNVPKSIYDTLASITDLQGKIETVEVKAKLYYLNDEMMEALDEIKAISKLIEEKGYKSNVQVDMSLITELDYYDGLIFKGYLPQSYKSIISGGRYDSFTGIFGKEVPAIGFSIDMDELTEINYEEG
ncbi:ATP phosphoribosyltransferase regulatory subunit [Lutispora thermophila]|uniref:ATP phosphoribosyltransferase regulatory subunit n=1 Tax=Lutispora thermophila DSM 19022 TaxID=1122184 RepID=A0A1M6FGS2_9FIRM|nr:ATP phosphoribosyltransferase regulatory subunit [Lutispora thermophila]SHI96856.1 ATP phosphoribosyltransferase regulatory subunit [Lutispora thermophila DSM 19022]